MEFNKIEEEIILLKAIKEIIDSMVNFEILSSMTTRFSIMFSSITHQSFFNIILVDFLSKTDKKAPIKQNLTSADRSRFQEPSFDINNAVIA